MSEGAVGPKFCSPAAVDRIRRAIERPRSGTVDRSAFLLLSGSFNPPHVHHVRILELSRQHLERLNWTVVGGFIAPSTDSYVTEKLAGSAMPLEERKRLCELAIGASAWLSVCPRGEFSSHTAASGIHDELHRECEGVLAGRTLTAVEIMGSDAAVRILNKILARSDGAPTRRTRTLCCVLRAGEDALFERRLLETDLIPRAARISIDVTLVDPGLADPPPKPVSSSQIMKLIERGQWDALRSGAWLHPSVLAALQQRFAWLSLEGSPEATSVD